MEPLARRPVRVLPEGPRIVYKLLTLAEWQAATVAMVFSGSGIDLSDGFIHLSSAAQVAETLARHFALVGQPLMVLAVDLGRVDGEVRWEASRHGALFPHVYGTIPVAAVVAAEPLRRDRDGGHILPDLPTSLLASRESPLADTSSADLSSADGR